jgi:hypothetical protein
VVTQVDTTFDNAKRDAMEEDKDIPTFEEVRAKEILADYERSDVVRHWKSS